MGHIRLEDVIIDPQPDFDNLLKVLTRSGKPDYIPFYELAISRQMMEKMLAKKVDSPASVVEFYYKAGYDYVPVWPNFTLTINNLIDSSSDYPIKDWKTFEEFKWPANSDIKYKDFEAYIPLLPNGMRIVAQVWGAFETVQSLFGYTGLCYMLADDPQLVEAVFMRVQELYEEMYRGMSSISEVGAVVISDDLGFNTQTLLSVKDLRKYVLPIHMKLTEIIHKAGKPCIYHSCGQLGLIMDDIIDIVQIDAKHSYEDSILPVTEAMDLYGDRIAILGGVDVDRMCRSNENDLRVYVKDLLEKASSRGGYALGSGNTIPEYINPDNYLAMLEEGWKARRIAQLKYNKG